MGKLKEKSYTSFDIHSVVSPVDLVKVVWTDMIVRDSEGRPRWFTVPYGRGYGGQVKRKLNEIRYIGSFSTHGWRLDRLRLIWLEQASESSVSPIRLYAFKGRLFFESKSKQAELEL